MDGAWVENLFASSSGGSGFLWLNTSQGFEHISFQGLESAHKDPLGDVFINFGRALDVKTANFFGVKGDYSVAGFARRVPDSGGTLALLGMGLISLIAVARKRETRRKSSS